MRSIIIILLVFTISSCGSRDRNNEGKLSDSFRQEYLQKGSKIANLTQAELLMNVSRAMQKGGPEYTVDFCSIHALSIKDSLSRMNNCEIRRIAQKYRNPADRPRTESEMEQLSQYQIAFEEGKPLESVIYNFDDRLEYYQPILLSMEACLKCHGTPGTHIDDATMEMIQLNYPEDLATGFKLNDIRGAWKITFMK